jgi:hypothetical protein
LGSLVNFSEVLGRRASQGASGNGFGDGLGGHEGVLKDFIESRSFGGVKDQNSLDKFFCLF